MMLKKLQFSWLSIFTLLILFTSCNRNNTVWDNEIYSSIDHSFAESEFSSIGNLFDYEARLDTNIYGKTDQTQGFYCPAASINVTVTGSSSATMVIDFGTGTNCLDGRMRVGKLRAEFSGKWKDAGSRVAITADGYIVNGYAFTFTQTVTINGRVDGKLNWTTTVENARLINSNTLAQINWETSRTTTWIEGEGDNDLNTNVYEITGNSSGIARNGKAFVAEVNTPLRVELSCPNIVAGVLNLTPDGLDLRSIDYGEGLCDGTAVLSVGNFQTTINLP